MIEIDLIRHVKVSGKAALYGCTDVAPIATENARLLQRLMVQQQTSNAYHSVISSSLSRCRLVAQKFSRLSQLPLTVSNPLQEMNFGLFDGIAFDDLALSKEQYGNNKEAELAKVVLDKVALGKSELEPELESDLDKVTSDCHNSDQSKTDLSWSTLEAFFHSPAEVILPQAESLTDFNQRITQAWQKLITQQLDIITEQKPSKTPRRVLLIAHGGVIRMILAHILQLDWKNPSWHQQLQIAHGSLSRIVISRPYFNTQSQQALPKQADNKLHQQVTSIAMPFVEGF